MAKFNSGTDSLYADALFWSGATSDTFPIDPDFTRSANFAVQRCTAAIQKADNTWKYADANVSTELIDSSTALQSGVAKYAISLTWLKIGRIRVKDPNGNLITLTRVQREQLSDSQLIESGTPWGYYKLGKFIYLVGIPNYSASAGLEVQFQTTGDLFTISDTTKEPGWAPQFHRLVSLLSALDFTESNEMSARSAVIRNKVGTEPDPSVNDPGSGMFREFVNFYTERDQDGAHSLSTRREDYGSGALGDNSGVGNNTTHQFNI